MGERVPPMDEVLERLPHGAEPIGYDYEQDRDQCPFCNRRIPFQAFDAHVKSCRAAKERKDA